MQHITSYTVTLISITQLPERYTWQDLKDLVRQEAAHGIWTEIGSPNAVGRVGMARVQRSQEAGRLYSKSEA